MIYKLRVNKKYRKKKFSIYFLRIFCFISNGEGEFEYLRDIRECFNNRIKLVKLYIICKVYNK